LIAELDGSGNALRTYGWLGKSGGLLWVKDAATGEFHVPSFDGNRNVTRLIKWSDRTVSAEYEYAPYGGQLRATGPMALANPIRFSSEYHDDVTGLVYYGLRYYSPQTHRWLSKDPIGYAGGLNLYGFVGGDPVNGVDWYGLQEVPKECMNMPPEKWDDAKAKLERDKLIEQANALRGAIGDAGSVGHELNERIDRWFDDHVPGAHSDGLDDDAFITFFRGFAETPGAIIAAPDDLLTGIELMSRAKNWRERTVGAIISAGAGLTILDFRNLGSEKNLHQTPKVEPDLPLYTINDEGLMTRAEGTITGSHPGRAKKYCPEPIGGRSPGDHKGHLLPENGVDDPKLVNVKPNIVSEAPKSNLSPKKIAENYAIRLADQYPDSKINMIVEPLLNPGETRPYAVSMWVTKNGEVVYGVSIPNR
jgi:RHS repeat-associated protein